MLAVVSSAVARIEYDAGNMQVWFAEGSKPYTYFGVPKPLYEAFLAAPSKGRFFNENIKDKFDK